jgi:hypothetical protein
MDRTVADNAHYCKDVPRAGISDSPVMLYKRWTISLIQRFSNSDPKTASSRRLIFVGPGIVVSGKDQTKSNEE